MKIAAGWCEFHWQGRRTLLLLFGPPVSSNLLPRQYLSELQVGVLVLPLADWIDHGLPPVLPARQIAGDSILNPVRLLGLVLALTAAAPLVVHLLLGAACRTLRQGCLTAPLK
jgi:hypothetical protein